MYWTPCARLMKSITPNTSVSPAAIRKSRTPNWSPFRIWTTTSPVDIALVQPPSLFHRTVFGIWIGVSGKHLFIDLSFEPTVPSLRHLHLIEILDRVVIGVELERTTQRREVSLHQCRTQRVLIRGISLGKFERAIDEKSGMVRLECIGRRNCAVLLLVVRNEFLVLRIIEIGCPVGPAEKSDRGLLLRWQRRFIDSERREELDLFSQTGLPELLYEVHAHATGQKDKDRVRRSRGYLREFGRIVELAERYINFVRNVTLKVALESGDGVLARLIIRRHQEHLFHSGVLRVFSHDLVVLVVLIRGDKEIRIAFLAGELGSARVRTDQNDAGIGHRLHDSDQHIGED